MHDRFQIPAMIGSRTFKDYDLLKTTIANHKVAETVSGGAAGAELLAKRYAVENQSGL